MIKYKTYLLVCFTAFLVSSCSKDYRCCIPSGCQALMSVDLTVLNNDAGADVACGRQEALQQLLMTDDVKNCGIDISERLYCFETADGEFGLVAKVASKRRLGEWLETLAGKNVCRPLGDKRGYDFYSLKESFLIAYSGNALLVMGPVVGEEQPRRQVQMARLLDADDGEGVMQSAVFARLEQMSGPVALIARADALPGKFMLPAVLGVPDGTDMSQVLLSADIDISDGIINVSGDVFSLDSSVDSALKKAAGSYRAVTGTDVAVIPSAAQFVLATNVTGADYLKLLRAGKEVRMMLMGINRAIDIDKMIASVDGDMILAVSDLEHGRMAFGMTAVVKNSDWVEDVAYWKKSCPRGTVIREDNMADGGLPQYHLSGSAGDVYFGMSGASTMYISTDSVILRAKSSGSGFPESVAGTVKGKRLCIIANIDELSRKKQEVAAAVDIMRPLLGDVHTLVYYMK